MNQIDVNTNTSKKVIFKADDKSILYKQLLEPYFSALDILAKSENINGCFWGTISARENLLKKIYKIDSNFFNEIFFVKEDTTDQKYKDLFELNEKCFSGKDSFYQEEILNKGLPIISDILPALNKSLIIVKNSKHQLLNLNNITCLFDYGQVIDNINNLITDGAQKIINIGNKNIIKNIIKILSSSVKVDDLISTIAIDYEGFENKKYTFEQIKVAFGYIFTMYVLHLSLGYDIFIYYPLQISPEAQIAFTLGLKYENFKNTSFNSFFVKYLKILNTIIFATLYKDISNEVRDHAIRSAVAAIMARNMSHNIGSHVLNYLSNPEEFDNLWVI